MWFGIVSLTVGVLLLDSAISGDSHCETIEILKETHHFDETIDVSSFASQHNDDLHKCVWLKSVIEDGAARLQWTGRFQITFSRHRSACANATVQIIYSQNGVTQSIEIRPNRVSSDRITSKVTRKMLLDLNAAITIKLRHINRNDSFVCMNKIRFIGSDISMANIVSTNAMRENTTRTTKTTKTTKPTEHTTTPTSHHTTSTTKTTSLRTTTKPTEHPTKPISHNTTTTTKTTSLHTTTKPTEHPTKPISHNTTTTSKTTPLHTTTKPTEHPTKPISHNTTTTTEHTTKSTSQHTTTTTRRTTTRTTTIRSTTRTTTPWTTRSTTQIYPPTATTSNTRWTPPNWPPSTNTITIRPTTTTTSTDSESSTATSTQDATSVEISPTAPPMADESDGLKWRIVSFVFIILVGLLLIVTLLLWIAMPKRKPIEVAGTSIPPLHLSNQT